MEAEYLTPETPDTFVTIEEKGKENQDLFPQKLSGLNIVN